MEHFLDTEIDFFGSVVKAAFCLVLEKFGTKMFFFLKIKYRTTFFFQLNRVEISAKIFPHNW